MATAERLIIESMFMIADKDGVDRDFLLNPQQAQLDSRLTGRDIIPKPRQIGISSYILGRYLAACLSKRNTRAVVISHDADSTQRMLSKVHYMLEHIRGPKAILETASKNEITFPKTNSRFYVGTAGSRKFGRGDTITHLHCSEVAFWENPKDLTAGLFQAVPFNGEIAIESTGNGVGNYYHNTCMRAFEGKGRFRLHFFNWLEFAEYAISLTAEQSASIMSDLRIEWEEVELVTKYHLTAGQILWRRYKLEELEYDLNLFKQEYPCTFDECFQSNSESFFHKVNYLFDEQWVKIDNYLWAFYPTYVSKRGRFVVGADVGGGVRKDRSIIQVIDILSNSQVAEWSSDRIDPEEFANRIKEVAEYYNEAYVVVEANNHGLTTLAKLKDIYPIGKIHYDAEAPEQLMGLGYKTTVKSRPLMIGRGRSKLAKGFLVRSPLLKSELSSFAEQEGGRIEGNTGCFDDRVMALLVAFEGALKAGLIEEEEEEQNLSHLISNPFSLEAILEWAKKRGMVAENFPVSKNIIVPEYNLKRTVQ